MYETNQRQHEELPKAVWIDLAAIVENNPIHFRRKPFNPQTQPKDNELVNSIQTHGILEPVMVQVITSPDRSDNVYQVIFGHRRIAAARLIRLEKVPALIFEDPDRAVLYLGMVENTGRLCLSNYEKALWIEGYRKLHPEMNDTEIAKALGLSKQTVSNLKQALNHSTPALLTLLQSECVDGCTILILQPIFAQLPESEQQALADLLTGGITREQAQALSSYVKQKVGPVKAAKWVLYKDFLHLNNAAAGVPNEDNPAEKKGSTRKHDTPLLNLSQEEQIQCLQAQTGLGEEKVKELLHQGQEMRVDLETVSVAGAAMNHVFDSQAALTRAKRIMEMPKNRRLVSLIRKRLQILSSGRAAIFKSGSEDQDFLNCFFGVHQA